MAAVTEIPVEQQYLTDDDPDLLRAQQMTGTIRWLELERSYLLAEKLKHIPLHAQAEVIERWALFMGRSAGAWKADLKWATVINPADLQAVFAEEHIGEREWTERIGTTHLRMIAKAKHQDNHQLLTSREQAEWARRAFHCNWSVEELTGALRDNDLLAAKRGSGLAAPSKTPTTLFGLLRVMLDQLEAEGQDKPLAVIRPGIFKAPAVLTKAAGMLTGIMFILGTTEGGKADGDGHRP